MMKYRIQVGHLLPVADANYITTPMPWREEQTQRFKILTSMKEWCKEYIGSNGWNYYGAYRQIPYEFRFKDEADMLAFKLTFVVK